MYNKIVVTKDEWVGFITRVTVGAIILPHGLQKVFGMFGGNGFDGTMGFLTNVVHLPWIIAFIVIMIESVGSLSLILGAFSRV